MCTCENHTVVLNIHIVRHIVSTHHIGIASGVADISDMKHQVCLRHKSFQHSGGVECSRLLSDHLPRTILVAISHV